MSETATMSGERRLGLALGVVLGLLNIPASFVPGGEDASGAPEGPPLGIKIVGIVLGLVVAGLLLWAARTGRRGPVRAGTVLLVLIALTAMPAFTIESVPAWVKLGCAAYLLGTLAAVVLMFWPAGKAVPDVG